MSAPADVAYCFVAKEDYEDFRSSCTDGQEMSVDYDVFSAKSRHFQQALHDEGVVAIKVYIKPAELVAWCRSHGREINADGRRAYAAFIAMKKGK